MSDVTNDVTNDEALLLEGQARVVEVASKVNQQVWVDLIREGFGNARDNHYYGPQVLEAAAPSFVGAKMYANHLSPEAQEKLKGYPRDIQEVMGRIRETKMAEDAEGKRVIRGRVSISQPWLWAMVEHDPELLGVSINARGRSREGVIEQREAKIVEAMTRVVSVDWVTEAGAGGKVIEVVEAQLEEARMSGTRDEELREDAADDWEPVEMPLEEDADEPDEDEPDEPGEDLEEVDEDDDLAEAWGDGRGTEWGNHGHDDDELDGEIDAPHIEDDGSAFENMNRRHGRPVSARELEEQIESRLEERLAQAREDDAAALESAVTAGVEAAEARFDAALEELEEKHARELTTLTQRGEAARVIERSDLPVPSQRVLKAEFHDFLAEATSEKTAEEVHREAVHEAIRRKKTELAEFTEARVSGAGETADSAPRRRGERREATLDKQIDAELGIEEIPVGS